MGGEKARATRRIHRCDPKGKRTDVGWREHLQVLEATPARDTGLSPWYSVHLLPPEGSTTTLSADSPVGCSWGLPAKPCLKSSVPRTEEIAVTREPVMSGCVLLEMTVAIVH